MGGITVAEINALTPGSKALAAPGVYIRRNSDDTATVTGRLKVGGKSVDVKIASTPMPITSPDLKALIAVAVSARQEHLTQAKASANAPAAPSSDSALAGKDATVGDVWRDLLKRIDESGKWSARNSKTNRARAAKYLEGSALFAMRAADVKPLHVADLLRPIGSRPDQMRKIRGLLSLAFTHAIALDLIQTNPAMSAGQILRVTQPKRAAGHFPTLIEHDELRDVLRRITMSAATPPVRSALTLQALTAQRSGEVVGARWDEFDLDAAEPVWRIGRDRMKIKDANRGAHVVPLSAPAVSLIRALQQDPKAQTSAYVFRGRDGGHIVGDALPKAMRDAGLNATFVPHSWRSALKTAAARAADSDGRPLFAAEWVETVLDHQPEDKITAAYQRGGHTAGARRVLDWWANVLSGSAS